MITDRESHLYLAFTHYPEPTVRRYDRFGYSTLEIALNTLEFAPVATAKRRVIWEQDQKGAAADLKPVVNAVGVDPASETSGSPSATNWCTTIRTGNRKGTTYRTFSPEGARVEPVSILVEPDRLLLAADPVGVFAFARPDKMSGNAEEKAAEKSEKQACAEACGALTETIVSIACAIRQG